MPCKLAHRSLAVINRPRSDSAPVEGLGASHRKASNWAGDGRRRGRASSFRAKRGSGAFLPLQGPPFGPATGRPRPGGVPVVRLARQGQVEARGVGVNGPHVHVQWAGVAIQGGDGQGNGAFLWLLRLWISGHHLSIPPCSSATAHRHCSFRLRQRSARPPGAHPVWPGRSPPEAKPPRQPAHSRASGWPPRLRLHRLRKNAVW